MVIGKMHYTLLFESNLFLYNLLRTEGEKGSIDQEATTPSHYQADPKFDKYETQKQIQPN